MALINEPNRDFQVTPPSAEIEVPDIDSDARTRYEKWHPDNINGHAQNPNQLTEAEVKEIEKKEHPIGISERDMLKRLRSRTNTPIANHQPGK